MKRRSFLGTSAAALALPTAQAAEAPSSAKTLRYAFRVAETGFDPARITDIYSRIITAHIFEGLVGYDHLARPALIKPVLAEALPEVSEDFKTWTFRIRRGVFFADDPAFKGQPREVTAEDFVYSLLRVADPATVSPSWGEIEDVGIVGLKAYRDQLRKGATFDYGHKIEGLQALDRYTLRIQLQETRPRFLQILAQPDIYGVVAREVIEAYSDDTAAHPVGTGPYKLVQWRRSSQIVLERNPGHRLRHYRDEVRPAPDDPEGQAWLARFGNRRIPMVDRVEVAIIEENQPRWLSFLDGQFNFLERVPEDFTSQAIPGNHLAPNLTKKGMQAYRVQAADVSYHVFNMDDPTIGGTTPEKVALRRAFGIALDCPREINLVRRGQGIVAQSFQLPHTTGYDARFKCENGEYDSARAKALLDLYGYIDRDGDGWREMPDGSPLELESLTTPDAFQRSIDTLYQKNLAAVGLKIRFKTAQWPDNLKAMTAGNFQIWNLAGSASMPDPQDQLSAYVSSRIGSYNYARFRSAEIDAIYARTAVLPDGPERLALFRQAQRIATAYMPYKYRLHRYVTDITAAGVSGYRRGPFWLNFWEYVDIG
ncbi:MAG: bicyclomycin resistance protein [Paucibacter sp.]|nr:bicyclomycin resistance protein [Roseateles sp.]